MKAMNKIEEMVLEMIREGKPLRGLAREIAIGMMLREQDAD